MIDSFRKPFIKYDRYTVMSKVQMDGEVWRHQPLKEKHGEFKKPYLSEGRHDLMDQFQGKALPDGNVDMFKPYQRGQEKQGAKKLNSQRVI